MTSETPSLHASRNLNIFKTKQDIEKLKTPLRLTWKCRSVLFKIGSKIFSLQWHFKEAPPYSWFSLKHFLYRSESSRACTWKTDQGLVKF